MTLTRAAVPFAMSRQGDILVVADAHLTDGDPEVEAFCRFLGSAASDAAAVVMLGDIFSLWLGARSLTRPCHTRVLEAVAALRGRGVAVGFVEGNREIGVSRSWGTAFDAASSSGLVAEHGGRRWFFAHGDRARSGSAAERGFRALLHSRAVQAAFFALPARTGLALGARIERALRVRNLRAKVSIRRADLEAYAERLAAEGIDAAAIGHLHVEMRVGAEPGARALLHVLPDWRSGRRFLRIPEREAPRVEPFEGGPAVRPAIIDVVERGSEAELLLDGPADLDAGSAVVFCSGHGPDVRRGRVVRLGGSSAEGARLVVVLEPGPPLQAGDRLGAGVREPAP